jgi:hypothetical protein
MEEIALPDEPLDTKPRRTLLTEKRWLLFVYVPVFTTIGLLGIEIVGDRKGLSDVFYWIAAIGLNISVFAWCKIDSRERGYKLHRFFPIVVIILGILVLLFYLFRSRGFRGGLISTGWLVLYAVSLDIVTAMIATIILIVLVLVGAVSPTVFNQ